MASNGIIGLFISAMCPLPFNGLSRPSLIRSISPVTGNLGVLSECNYRGTGCRWFLNYFFAYSRPYVYFHSLNWFIKIWLPYVLGYIIRTTLCLRCICVRFVTALTANVFSVLRHFYFSWLYLLCLSLSGTLASSQGIMGKEIRSNFAQLRTDSLISNALLHKLVSRLQE